MENTVIHIDKLRYVLYNHIEVVRYERWINMNNYKTNALIFKAFCDENRLRIIESLQKGEKCACTLLEEIPIVQSTLSHHMKILVDSSIVNSRKEGKWTYYSLSDEGKKNSIVILETLLQKEDEYNTYHVCDMNGGQV